MQVFPRSRRRPQAPRSPRSSRLRTPTAARLLLLLCAGLFPGCVSLGPRDLPLSASYRPENIYSASPVLPLTLKRVAVLPIAADGANLQLADARPALQEVLHAELLKTRKFEILEVSPEFLTSRTGRPTWGGEETLPPDLLDALCRALACDGVLFCRLTAFRGYAPLAVGWRLRLVDTHTASTLWAVDEFFDAGQPAVSAAARRYQLAAVRPTGDTPDEWSMAHSPRQFAQYTAAHLLATLPQR